MKARLGGILASLMLLAGMLPGAAIRNVVVDPPFLCPGQAFTVRYEASAKINTDLAAGAFISSGTGMVYCPTGGDWHFLGAGSPVGGKGSGVTPTSCVYSYDALTTIHPGDSIVAYRPYSAVGRVPYGYAVGSTLIISIAVSDGYSSYAGWGGYTKVTIGAEVSCTKKQAYNTGGYWYGSTNDVGVIIETDPAACGTPTDTPSRTPTPSATPTRSFTLTRTPTPSATPTRTFSATPTATPSFTLTDTRTASATQSATATTTFSFTQTDTRTASPTASDTPTLTPTPTQSVTRSATPSISPSPTPSFTPSPPFSPTNTPTQTLSFTPSDTPTPTLSFTPTFTRTATPSVTPSYTDSFTATETPSRTVTPSHTPTVTETLQYSATSTPTWTDTPSNTPSSTPTLSFSPSATLTDTPTASPSFTPTQTFSFTATATPSVTLTPSFTDSPTQTISPTITQTPIPVPYQVSVTIYNAAGERVKLLFDGSAAVLPTDVSLDKAVFQSGLDSVTLDMFGALSGGGTLLSWKGENDSAQVVKGGVYYFKVEYHDPFGTTTSFVKSVQVLEGKAGNHLDVFNSAGELVNRVDFNALTQTVTSFSLDKEQIAAAYQADGTSEDKILVSLSLSDGSTQSFNLEGRGLNGQPLTSGTYTLVLVADTQQGTQVSSKSIMVLRAPDAGLSWEPVLGPNPATLQGGHRIQIRYPAGELLEVRAGLYNQAGELVQLGRDTAASGTLWLDYDRVSSGIYVAVLEARLISGAPYRRVLKVAIVR